MFADLDETMRQILIEELPIKNGEIDVHFDQPNREWSAKLSKPTLNLFLYDVRENNQLRQHAWQRVREENGNVTQKRSPMRVDLIYMLTTWGNDPADEHRLLSRAMIALFRYPILPEDRLIGTMRNPPHEITSQLARHDRLTNPAEVWSSLDNEMRPSVNYVITLSLDPWHEFTGPAVKSLVLNTGQSKNLPRYQLITPDDTRNQLAFLGGTITSKAGDPVEGVTVALKDTGFLTQTSENGRYVLHGFQPGEYTLIAWPEKGKPKEKKVHAPVEKGMDFDLEI